MGWPFAFLVAYGFYDEGVIPSALSYPTSDNWDPHLTSAVTSLLLFVRTYLGVLIPQLSYDTD